MLRYRSLYKGQHVATKKITCPENGEYQSMWQIDVLVYFWNPRRFRKIEKTHYTETKRVTYRIVVVYERSQCWIGVLVMVVLHNMLEEPLIWWIIVHCVLIIIIVQEHECVQVKYSIHTVHHSETSGCMNGWGKL